jgi:hypothetical protein
MIVPTATEVSAVSKAIDQLAAPNEEVASFWPGYIFAPKETHTRALKMTLAG